MNDFINYEEWIGQSLKTLQLSGDLSGQLDVHNLKFKRIKRFFGMFHNEVSLFTEGSDKITSVSILLKEMISQSSFEKMIKMYGEPNTMFVPDKIIREYKTESTDGFKQNLAKSEFSSKQVQFHESPEFIIWKKMNFQIKMHLLYKYNATQVLFVKSK